MKITHIYHNSGSLAAAALTAVSHVRLAHHRGRWSVKLGHRVEEPACSLLVRLETLPDRAERLLRLALPLSRQHLIAHVPRSVVHLDRLAMQHVHQLVHAQMGTVAAAVEAIVISLCVVVGPDESPVHRVLCRKSKALYHISSLAKDTKNLRIKRHHNYSDKKSDGSGSTAFYLQALSVPRSTASSRTCRVSAGRQSFSFSKLLFTII